MTEGDDDSAAETLPQSDSETRGLEVIRAALATMPSGPGVYRMLDAKGNALYVGKARSLKKRVTQYLQLGRMSNRLQRMVNETRALEIVTTHTEVEALLLEINLIKRLMPRYNVLLRDDKSFPYIVITGQHAFPRIAKHRGARDKHDRYFGPFASAGAVNQTLTALQRAFLLRSCSDPMFASRTRPCLLYQIKRCSGPCVGRIDEAGYRKLVDEATAFLAGQSREVQTTLAAHMQKASEELSFETAALFRDRIRALTQIQSRQDINVEGLGDADVIAAHQAGGMTAIQVFFFRGGRNYGNRPYFPRHDRAQGSAEVLAAFVGQFYEDRPAPPLVLLSEDIAEAELLAEALSQKAGHKVRLWVPERGDKRKPVEHALTNAREALGRRLAETGAQAELLEGVARVFALDESPRRIEVYDNSHTQGTAAQGAMIVAGPEGFIKGAYRRFNIRGGAAGAPATAAVDAALGLAEAPAPEPAAGEGPTVPTGGDDYAMMREVFRRRFQRALEEDPSRDGESWPDLVLVDGGLGQLNAARGVLAELGLEDLCVAGIAKGPDRDAGRERFFIPGREPFQLEPRDPVLYFLQRLRDEAHRFAIGGHRARRTREAVRSPLDDVPGIGPKRKKALLVHFGSAKAVARSGLADLESAPGVSKSVAKKVYDHFHGPG